jgi:hypothetical protein
MVKREGGRQGNSVPKAFVAQSEQLSSGLVAAKWLIVRLLMHFGNVWHPQQTSVRIEHRRGRATQPGVTAAKMLGTMHENRPSIRDAGADTVCAFDPLRPDAAHIEVSTV